MHPTICPTKFVPSHTRLSSFVHWLSRRRKGSSSSHNLLIRNKPRRSLHVLKYVLPEIEYKSFRCLEKRFCMKFILNIIKLISPVRTPLKRELRTTISLAQNRSLNNHTKSERLIFHASTSDIIIIAYNSIEGLFPRSETRREPQYTIAVAMWRRNTPVERR